MNEPSRDPMDMVVKAWLNNAEPSPQHLAELRTRILEAVEREHEERWRAREARIGRGSRVRWWSLAAGAAVAAAACLAVLAPWRSTGRPELAAESVPQGIGLDRQQLLDQARLFAQMNEVFSGRLAWIAESDGRVELGLEPRSAAVKTDRRTVAVRLVVVTRAAGETAWRRCWGTDLLVENEEAVELKPQDSTGRELMVWALALPDGLIAVDTSLQFSSTQPEMVYSGVERPGVSRPILSWKAEGREYRVFQTVVFLPREVG